MEREDLERIARKALTELGVSNPDLTVTPDAQQPGVWRLDLKGVPNRQLKIRCGQGTTAQYVREQVFQEFAS